MVDKGFVGKSLGFGKNDYGDSGMFYAWILALKIKYCLVFVDFDVFSAKRTFKGNFEEHRMIRLDGNTSLSERKLYQVDFRVIGQKRSKE